MTRRTRTAPKSGRGKPQKVAQLAEAVATPPPAVSVTGPSLADDRQIETQEGERMIGAEMTIATPARRRLAEPIVEQLAELWCEALLSNLRRHPIEPSSMKKAS